MGGQKQFNSSKDDYIHASHSMTTLGAMNNLAVILQGQSQNDEAEKLLRHVIHHNEHIFGPDHPLTLIGLSNLVRLLCDVGDAKAAEGLAPS